MKNRFLIVLMFLLCYSISFSQTEIYLDPNAAIDDRVEDLLSKMTLEEKVGQMTQADHLAVKNLDDVKTYYLGSILSGGGSDPVNNTPKAWADLYDKFQAAALTTRLKIPIIYGIDAVHGHSNVYGATMFPHNIGLGATRNPELIKKMSEVTASEIAATGIDWTFAPCIAVARDERWGRTYESFGETPELAELFAGPSIVGLQKDSLNDKNSIVACAKHYVGDGGTFEGDDQGNTIIDEEELRRIHLPGYLKAIENDVKTIMASYNSWNGEKLHGQKYLLTDVLKEELGFKGFIVSDWAAIDQLPGNYISDIEQSINAGIDMVMVPNEYSTFFDGLTKLVNDGKVTQDRIDDAVNRILKVKFELGLFEKPYSDRSEIEQIGSVENREVARQAVRESIVFLQKKDNVLPLPKSAAKILVAGKHANDIGLQCGGWTIQWQGSEGNITPGTTILKALQNASSDNEIIYSEDGNFDETEADYIIAVIGEKPYAEGEGDRSSLDLDNSQNRMIKKLKKLNIPVITILISGRPMIINPALHYSDVFISAWLPGTEGDGIADVLFGDYNPAGLLSHSWPKNIEQVPINYGDENYDPLFEYGYGITSLENSDIGSAPIVLSACLDRDNSLIEISFNKDIDTESLNEAVFEITKNNIEEIEITSISIVENSRIALGINYDFNNDDKITVSYKSGNVQSADGGVLVLFDRKEVVNYAGWSNQLSIPGLIEAEDFSSMIGVQTENSSDVGGGINVGWIDDNDWIEYEVSIQSSGTYIVDFRIASESSIGKIKLHVDGITTAGVTLPVTGGWQSWRTESTTIDLETGDHTIRILAEKGGFNLNWIDFSILTEVNNKENIVIDYDLGQNYPNPFNPTTQINFSIPNSGFYNLKIFNLLGETVKTLASKEFKNGEYSIVFNASGLSSGTYIYSLEGTNVSLQKKMVLLK